ncbi:hypothetical protein CBR_g48536 [Chara braunii]|uniref:Uncharacterized protein n=1 Tax=Chara braunii TaxID=69332 RepID=A0A388M2Y5_CHABU|nr:hypothetical protein CBR_g48536 [Chara braunii]|eukprot:GBG88924.1 hypothetical protein CBR_g48536 [Chara braunii]
MKYLIKVHYKVAMQSNEDWQGIAILAEENKGIKRLNVIMVGQPRGELKIDVQRTQKRVQEKETALANAIITLIMAARLLSEVGYQIRTDVISNVRNKSYEKALSDIEKLIELEPENQIAQEFRPLLMEKIELDKEKSTMEKKVMEPSTRGTPKDLRIDVNHLEVEDNDDEEDEDDEDDEDGDDEDDDDEEDDEDEDDDDDDEDEDEDDDDEDDDEDDDDEDDDEEESDEEEEDEETDSDEDVDETEDDDDDDDDGDERKGGKSEDNAPSRGIEKGNKSRQSRRSEITHPDPLLTIEGHSIPKPSENSAS